MKVVLLSGGSGKRLWPMSNDSRSKQFLKVLPGEDGNRISMLQRVWGQLDNVGLQNNTFICSSHNQYETIESQVGEVAFIEEPDRRDTFPAIALATTYLADVVGCNEDEVVAVLPVDPFVGDSFFRTVKELQHVIDTTNADLVLMGVKPSEPSSKFGYMRISEPNNSVNNLDAFRVASFVEKPTKQLAQSLIAEGALWNCGVFCFRIRYLRERLNEFGYPTTYHELKMLFTGLPKRSFDYEIVEKAKNIVAVAYEGTWDDLGTWGALSNKIEDEFVGLGNSVECDETHVVNELGIPLVAMGLQNTMIVSTPDGILVANKDKAASIKDVIAEYSSRPMFEERRWGSYRVLDYQKLEDGTQVLTKCIELLPGRNISYQRHMKRSEVWSIIQGSGEFVLESKIVTVTAGDVIRIHPGQWHALRASEKLMFIEVQSGAELVEEDVIRRYFTWDEITQHCAVIV